jgi:hypothetical protein
MTARWEHGRIRNAAKTVKHHDLMFSHSFAVPKCSAILFLRFILAASYISKLRENCIRFRSLDTDEPGDNIHNLPHFRVSRLDHGLHTNVLPNNDQRKSTNLWLESPCSSGRAWRFGQTCRLHVQGIPPESSKLPTVQTDVMFIRNKCWYLIQYTCKYNRPSTLCNCHYS